VLAPAEFKMIPTQVEYLVPMQVQVTLIIDQTIDTRATSSSPLCRYLYERCRYLGTDTLYLGYSRI
jgi:hypothetical protein